MISKENEHVEFKIPVLMDGKVNDWLEKVDHSMCNTLFLIMENILNNLEDLNGIIIYPA